MAPHIPIVRPAAGLRPMSRWGGQPFRGNVSPLRSDEFSRAFAEALRCAVLNALGNSDTLDSLAAGSGVNRADIGRLLRGADRMTLAKAERLAAAFEPASRARFLDVLDEIEECRTVAALETLSIVAYKQPVTRAELESIRGVAVEGVLKTLVDRELVRITGREEGMGRPLLYGTTPHFLEYFGLPSLDALPRPDELEILFADRERQEELELEGPAVSASGDDGGEE